MTILNGKKESYLSNSGMYERKRYDVIVKNEGNYTETLISQELYEDGMIVDGIETPYTLVDNTVDYAVYPNMSIDEALVKAGIVNYPWSTPLTEV